MNLASQAQVAAAVRGLLAAGLLMAAARAQQSGVLREVYGGIAGSALSNLTNHAAFPSNPTSESLEPAFEAPTEFGDNYGQRMRAILTAPATGDYVFYVASDDQGVLYLSSDATPANKRRIAGVDSWTSAREWTKEAGQRSAAIPLIAGRAYYLEALQKEGGGGDNLAVGWTLPGTSTIDVLPNAVLTPYGLTPPIITQQPSDLTAIEGSTALFTVRLERMLGATFQWRRSGLVVPEATTSQFTLGPLAVGDNGTTVDCAITNPLGQTNSRVARLTVQPDTTRPTLASVSYLGDVTRLTVLFSEPVDLATATALPNYAVDQGVIVLEVRATSDPAAVLLRTTPLQESQLYTLTVSGVNDRAASPNTILPNSTRAFNLNALPLDISRIQGAREPPGPATRRSALAVTEILYHPAPRPDGRNLEFVELYNAQPWPEDLGGCRLSGDIDYTFPADTQLPGRSYLVVAANPADLSAAAGVITPHAFSGRLPNDTGRVVLRNNQDAVLCDIAYRDDPPWPVAADGSGHSLVLARPSWGQSDPRAWSASTFLGGSPGLADPTDLDPAATVLINEFLAHTDDPQLDFVELYNYGTAPVVLDGYVLTDDPTTNRFVIPPATTLPARGRLAFDQMALGFALDAAGETLWFKNPTGTRVLEAVRFAGQANGVATGRTPDGAPDFAPLVSPTPAAPNAARRLPEVVLNELMYEPISGEDALEFVELHNAGTQTIDLAGWRLEDAVEFTVPPGTTLPPGAFLVIGRDPARLMATYAHLNPANTLGGYSGTLANRGECLALSRPDQIVTTNTTGQRLTNTIHIVTDEVCYRPGGRWGRWSAGGGSSLERVDPRADGRWPAAWSDSDESTRSDWVTVEHTGVLDNGNTDANRLECFLLGPGEALIDNLEVLPGGGANVVSNGDFSLGVSGWTAQGNQSHSLLASSGGVDDSPCLHLRATGRGDTGANRIRTALTTPLSPGSTATLRARVRWLKGQSDFLMRLHGNWLDATTNLLTTQALGTPGRANSTRANAGPSITDVVHDPILPPANTPVQILARAADPDGLATLFLRYRLEPATNWISVSMTPRGAGFFSGTIPGRAANSVVSFYLEASDAAAAPALARFPADAPDHTGVVVFGARVGTGAFGTYHLWMNADTVSAWTGRERLSNDPLDLTFVYGNSRVVYNAGGQYSGSPYHSPGYNSPLGNYCDYVITFPPDDPCLGETDVNLLLPGNGCCENSLQREQTAFWFARRFGIPFNHRRHVYVYANNQARAPLLMEDSQQANGDFADQWWGGDNAGDLHKIQLWFEFDDAAAQFSPVGASFGNFTTTGGARKLARYRWNWARRAARESINNYTNLFALHDTLLTSASGDTYTRLLEATLDVDEWARTVACEHLYGNVDSFAYGGGQNLYVYRPAGDRWRLILWDLDFAFLSEAADASLFSFGGDRLNRLLSHPPFRRRYYRALQHAADDLLNPTRAHPVLDARYAAFTSAGLAAESPQAIKNYLALKRQTILAELARVSAPYTFIPPSGPGTANLAFLTGTAPIPAAQLQVNGIAADVSWSTLTNWSLRLPLGPGPNAIQLAWLDAHGQPLSGASATLTLTNTTPADPPESSVVISEIMFNPPRAGTSYLELFNRSTTTYFDLADWRLDGLDLSFAPHTLIAPQGYLVLPRNTVEFVAAYGPTLPLGPEFPGELNNAGERLRLLRPLPGGAESVIDDVLYRPTPPWPTAADGWGSSLQLVDPRQDNRRVGNWSVSAPTTNLPPQPLLDYPHVWRFTSNDVSSLDWTAPQFSDTAWPSGPGLLYVESAALPGPKTTALPAVAPTYYARAHFTFTGPTAGAALRFYTILDDGAVLYLNGSELHRIRVEANPVTYTTLTSSGIGDAGVEGPFIVPAPTLVTGDNVLAVEIKQSGTGSSDVVWGMAAEVTYEAPLAIATPGRPNSTAATLNPFPTLWINELQTANHTTRADAAGDHDPWVELYNDGTNTAALDGLALAPDYTHLAAWPFPAGLTLPPRQFLLVWLDGEAHESSPTELHAGFRLPAEAGTLCLVQLPDGPRILDYLPYDHPGADRSLGSVPDGDPYQRRILHYPTPGTPNNGTTAPVQVVINEWMTANQTTLADPADGDFEDWFELHNLADTPVDLSGYFLTDDLADLHQFQVPPGLILPPRGFLVVWADEESGQSDAAQGSLHLNFKLDASGDDLALVAPDGSVVDALRLGPLTRDQSAGRFPDGAAALLNLPAATPGAANANPGGTNQSPVLQPVPDRAVRPGQTIEFQIVATDPDLPAQSLSFSLFPGAPPGTGVNPVSGWFAWTPPPLSAPGRFDLTVQVSDNGVPPRMVQDTFAIHVIESLSLTATLSPGEGVALECPSTPNLLYQVFFKDTLDDPVWTPVAPATPGTGDLLRILDPTPDRPQRFYLLVVQ